MNAAIPKYALREYERRWLILGDGPDLAGALGRTIEDLYVDGTRLRLRRIAFDDGRLEFKLCKKYGPDATSDQPIANLYLTEAEHRALSALPGHRLRKRRYGAPPFGFDIFEGALAGLRMCEAEAAPAETLATIAPPPWAGPEVTGKVEWSGAALARAGLPREWRE